MQRLVVLSADPGVATGYAVHVVGARHLMVHGQVGSMTAVWWRTGTLRMGSTSRNVDAFLELARTVYEDHTTDEDMFVIVLERFTLLMNSTDPDLLEPVRFNAIVEDRLAGSGQVIEVQGASEAKHAVTDQRLSLWGVYKPGPDHQRDAQRHGLLFFRRFTQSAELRKRVGWDGE